MKFERLRYLRENADMTQKALGEYLHISQRAYAHYENGTRDIPVEMLIRLASYYHTSIDYIVGLSDERSPKDRKPNT